MTASRQAVELSIGERICRSWIRSRVANGTGEPGRAGADAAGLSGRPVFLCGGSSLGSASSDRPALRRAGARPMVRWRRSMIVPRPGQGADDHGRGQDLAGGAGVSEGQGTGLSARAVDDAAAGRHAREHGPAAGHACLGELVQGTVCKILDAQEVKPHKVRYYLERRDPEFEAKMAEVLCVYREVSDPEEGGGRGDEENKPSEAVTVISYDEKPGIQAIATTAPDLPPEPGVHATFTRDHEYKRHGTVSLLAGIDLLTGQVHALVKDRHRSREFIEFLKLLDAAYPADTAIKSDPRQSFRTHLQGDQSLARRPTGGPLRIHLHAQARLLAQPRRGLLLQARPLGAAPHPRRIQTGTQGPHHGRHGSTSTDSPSSTLGPTNSTRPPDMIRTTETMN